MKNIQLKEMLYALIFVILLISLSPVWAQKTEADIVIGKYVKLYSKILKEDRTLLVHLPNDYEKSKLSYPVLYLLYGNHVTTYFGEAVAILDRLGPTGRIPEMILVGITNTNRYRDLLPQGPDGSPTGIADFIRFFEEEFIPYVEDNYRTKNYRLVVGPQAGANFVLYTLFEKTELFDACFINSPFRWEGGRDMLLKKAQHFLGNNPVFKKYVHITYDDSDPLAIEGNKYINQFSDLAKHLQVDGFQVNLNFVEGNDEFLQPLGLRKGLKDLFKEYPYPDKEAASSLNEVRDYYEGLSQKYGFEVDIPEHVLNMEANKMMQQGSPAEAETIFQYMLKNYSNSANAFFGMANISEQDGKLEEACGYYQKMLEILDGDHGLILSRVKILEKKIEESGIYAVEKEIQHSGFSAGLRKFHALRNDSETELYFDEGEINAFGYRLIRDGKVAEAIQIFQLNVEMYPRSANAFDSLAEAYMRDDQKDLAVQNYQKSLELNPKNENAKEMLKRLKEKI